MRRVLLVSAVLLLTLIAILAGAGLAAPTKKADSIWRAQVPGWSKDDLDFFLHGSMGTEVFPEPVLRAFIAAYP